MKTVRAYAAQPFRRDDSQVTPVTIVIGTPFPSDDPADPLTPERAADLHQFDAEAVAEALWESLPGGTVDALLGVLLRRRASLLHVTFPKEKQHHD